MLSIRSIGTALWSFWRDGRPVERAAYLVGAVLLFSGLVHLAILVLAALRKRLFDIASDPRLFIARESANQPIVTISRATACGASG